MPCGSAGHFFFFLLHFSATYAIINVPNANLIQLWEKDVLLSSGKSASVFHIFFSWNKLVFGDYQSLHFSMCDFRSRTFFWEEKYMYCAKCGKKLPDEAKFCLECGNVVQRSINVIQPNDDIIEKDDNENNKKRYWLVPKIILEIIVALSVFFSLLLLILWIITIPGKSTFEENYVHRTDSFYKYYIVEFHKDGSAVMGAGGHNIVGNYTYDPFKNVYNIKLSPNIVFVATEFVIEKGEDYKDNGIPESYILVTGGFFNKTRFISK